MKSSDALAQNRDAIDAIDRDLIRLLSERMQAVRVIAGYKRDNVQAPLYDADRERALFDVWAKEGARHGISGYFLGRVLREILSWSRRDQERHLDRPQVAPARTAVRVAYQGAPASYSDLALEKLFASRPGPPARGEGYESFGATLDALEAGEVEYALLPIENTIAGSIHEVYGLLAAREVAVVDEEVWHVEHVLAALPGARLEDLRVVRSHPVALQQCQRFLRGLVGARAESFYDTAAAAASVAEAQDPTVAALCSAEAARRSGLVVLREGVADQRANITRFLLVAREPEALDARVPAKTSLLLAVNHRHGALAECLQAFAREGLNLTKLESRPQADAPWEYLFYVDVEGGTTDPRLASALAALKGFTRSLRVLGSYPCRTAEAGVPSAAAPPAPVFSPEARTAPADAASNGACPSPAATAARRGAPKLVGLPDDGRRSVVRVGAAEIGGERFTLIAGPCAVESRAQIMAAAEMVRQRGASLLRGGAFKPRSSPYSFQGLGFEGLDLLAEAGAAFELPVVTEVLRQEDAARIAERADVLQVGARNMQNFALLKELGRLRRPVLLKRGMSATVDELLQAAEYIMAGGNHQVILCERGIRTFETATRNTLDVSAVPVLKERTHLPVIVDPSHAAGRRELVLPLALAAAAAGADGLIVEAHPDPSAALCDKEQALTADDLDRLLAALEPIVTSQGRRL